MLATLACLAITAIPDTARVLVVQNDDSPASVEIASDYQKRRKVRNLLRVKCQDSSLSVEGETIAYPDFQKSIEDPLRTYLQNHQEIDFIVLTKGVPIRISGAPIGAYQERPSLDSYLAALDYPGRKESIPLTMGRDVMKGKCWANRYWNSNERFSHRKFGGYLVTRLDGYTVEDAKALTTRSLEASRRRPSGPIFLDVASSHGIGDKTLVPKTLVSRDEKGEVRLSGLGYNEWDTDMVVAHEKLAARKVNVEIDNTETFVGNKTNLMGYASWGSNDPKFSAESYLSLRFAPGAIVETAVSSSARTFLPTNEGQSLIADLLKNGATGAKGYVNEPFLMAVASPTVLFDRYTRGWTLAESYYAASRFVAWEDVVVGDPLCSPYRGRSR